MAERVSAGGSEGGPEDIVALLEERLQIRVGGPDVDLLEEGLLDSLAFVDLLLALEARYGVEIRMDEIDFDDFRTARAIAGWVSERLPG